jgi:predicted GNAT family acetyltransferase
MSSRGTLPAIHVYPTAAEFLARMQPLLERNEARNGLMLGIALVVSQDPQRYGEVAPYFATAEDDDGIAAAALMTPPHGVVLYADRADPRPALHALTDNLLADGWHVPTANGPVPVSRHFADLWTAQTGSSATLSLAERVFELRQVIPPVYSSGHLRPAAPGDLEQVAQWYVAFSSEALPAEEHLSLERALLQVERGIQRGAIFLWDDGGPVSLAACTRPTLHGIAIGPVYTPPEWRKRGYASSLVAQLSQRLLDEGRDFCTLFTDLANPTSNRIYQAIGYRPVCDFAVYRFTPA